MIKKYLVIESDDNEGIWPYDETTIEMLKNAPYNLDPDDFDELKSGSTIFVKDKNGVNLALYLEDKRDESLWRLFFHRLIFGCPNHNPACTMDHPCFVCYKQGLEKLLDKRWRVNDSRSSSTNNS